MKKVYKKILIIGAGPVIIGQSSEYDYSAVQMCKAFKQEGIETVVINSNPDTIITDKKIADSVYIEALNSETVKKLIEIEKPDAVLATVGGKNGLEICIELLENGYLAEHNTELLGINPEALKSVRTSGALRETLGKMGEPYVDAEIFSELSEVIDFAKKIGYPVSLKPAFTPDFANIRINNELEIKEKFDELAEKSIVNQVFIQKCVDDYKGISFEVVRDSAGNCISVSSTENVNPVGIHTGDSIVVVPAQTLSDTEFSRLRRSARKIANNLKIEGNCSVNYALSPLGDEYVVLSVLPRVNSSTTLVSKVTGYPIARVAAKIALGYNLFEIENEIAEGLTAANEPAIDYCAVKVPKWSFENFGSATRHLGETMQATGEVLSIGTSFELSFMKAIRSINPKTETISLPKLRLKLDEEILSLIASFDDEYIFAIYEAIKRGIELKKLNEMTKISMFFLSKFKNIADTEKEIAENFSEDVYYKAKKLGFLDSAIQKLKGSELEFTENASFNTVDTCSAEFDTKKPYFYSSFDEENEALTFQKNHKTDKKKILVIGSGPTSVGLGTDRDYAAVHTLEALKDFNYFSVMLNNNPAAVSTDFNMADKLYLDPITDEDVKNVVLTEKPYGAILPFGGGNAIRKSEMLKEMGVKIFGADEAVHKSLKNKIEFFDILDELNIKHTNSRRVLIGRCVEVDAISDGEDFLVPGICEHIEKALIHSGDSISVYPSVTLSENIEEKITDYTNRLVKKLKYKGLINIQFVVYDNEVYLVSASVVATRNIPFMAKATNLPIIEIATRVMLGETLKDIGIGTGVYKKSNKFFVKVPVFSFEHLGGADVKLSEEMQSTGEVMGIAETFEEALLKGYIASGMRIKRTGGVLITVANSDKPESVLLANEFLNQGFKIYATSNTSKLLNSNHVASNTVRKIHEGEPNTMTLIKSNKLSYVVSTSEMGDAENEDDIKIRRTALLRKIPVIPSVQSAMEFAKCLSKSNVLDELKLYKL
ncbi:MAG: carbamoyl-phosphate synthase large subunit [Oscillospiraceae bacterium]